jgi:hypothetical protein
MRQSSTQELQMSYSQAPVPRDESLTWRESLTVSGAALTNAPWGIAVAGGAVVGGGYFLLHLASFPVVGSVLLGLQVLLAVAAGGALWKRRAGNRAVTWARSHPWRFAALPAVITGVVTVPVEMIFGLSGPFSAIWTGIGRGVGTWVLVALVALIARSRQD